MNGSPYKEHGIGIEKQNYLIKEVSLNTVELMQGVKQVFEPDNILNPEKIFPNQMKV